VFNEHKTFRRILKIYSKRFVPQRSNLHNVFMDYFVSIFCLQFLLLWSFKLRHFSLFREFYSNFKVKRYYSPIYSLCSFLLGFVEYSKAKNCSKIKYYGRFQLYYYNEKSDLMKTYMFNNEEAIFYQWSQKY